MGREWPVPVGIGKPVGIEKPVGNGSPVGKLVGLGKDVPVGSNEMELSCLKRAGRAAVLTEMARPVVRIMDVKCMFAFLCGLGVFLRCIREF